MAKGFHKPGDDDAARDPDQRPTPRDDYDDARGAPPRRQRDADPPPRDARPASRGPNPRDSESERPGPPPGGIGRGYGKRGGSDPAEAPARSDYQAPARPSERFDGPPRAGYGDRPDNRQDRSSGYDDRRGGGYNDQRGGGYNDQRGGGYDDRRGGYDDRRGGYDDRRGGYDDRRGGYDDRRGGGHDDRRGGGYQGRGGNYNDQRGGGHDDRRGGGYQGRSGGYDDRRGGNYNDRRGGNYDDRRGGNYDDRRSGNYDDRRGGNYDDRRGGNYDDRRSGNYDDRRGGNYDDRRGGGYQARSGGGYQDRRSGGGYEDRRGGYDDRRAGGPPDRRGGSDRGNYPDRQGGYQDRRGSYDNRRNNSNSNSSSGGSGYQGRPYGEGVGRGYGQDRRNRDDRPRDERPRDFGSPSARRDERREPTDDKRRFKPPTPPNLDPDALNEPIRLNKFVARSTRHSRKEADELVKRGRVTVNGEQVGPGTMIEPGDVVLLDEKPISRRDHLVYILINKPRGIRAAFDEPAGADDGHPADEERDSTPDASAPTTEPSDAVASTDAADTATVPAPGGVWEDSDEHEGTGDLTGVLKFRGADQLTAVHPLAPDHLGLQLVSNDPQLARHFAEHPPKETFTLALAEPAQPEALAKIPLVEGGNRAGVLVAEFATDDRTRVSIVVRGGYPAEVLAKAGLQVERADRLHFAGLTKKDLPRGHWRFLGEREITWVTMFQQ